MEVKVRYVASLEDYYAADESFRAIFGKKRIDLYLSIALIGIAIAFVFVDQLFLGGVVALVAFIVHQGYAKRWIVKRNFRNIPNSSLEEMMVFSQKSIRYICDDVEEVIGWDEYAAYLENESVFVLFYDSSDYYAVVPKRSFESEYAINELREILKDKLADYKVYNNHL